MEDPHVSEAEVVTTTTNDAADEAKQPDLPPPPPPPPPPDATAPSENSTAPATETIAVVVETVQENDNGGTVPNHETKQPKEVNDPQGTAESVAGADTVTTSGPEPTSRDVIVGPGLAGIPMNDLLHDMVRLECILWRLNHRPIPQTATQEVKDSCEKLMNVILKGKPLELAGLKDVPRPFLRSQGRFLARESDNNGNGTGFRVMEEEEVRQTIYQLFLGELKKDLGEVNFSETPYKELTEMVERSKTPNPNDNGIVLVPDPKDAILLRRGASNADKLYESHVGNKVVFSLISQVVTTFTTTIDLRVEAALNLLQGLQDAASTSSTASASEVPLVGDAASSASNQASSMQSRKARFLLRNIREDESVFWSILDPADAALFAICFVFEVYLEKEIHLQVSHPSVIKLKDSADVLVEYSETVGVEITTDMDVLFGRGGMTNAHPGNRRFRDIIALHRPDYIRALKMDKPVVARKIVKAIRRGGRFLKKNEDGLWYDVGDRTAAEKTSQGLRERTNAEKRQRSALREALRIRRQDMTEETTAEAKEAEDDKKSPESSSPSKKQKTEPTTPNVSILNYVGTNMAVPLSLGMKGTSATPSPSPAKRKKPTTVTASAAASNSVELFTEGLPPNAVDEEGNILVTDYDILCGRGGLTNHHKGNKRFRDVVALHRPDYVRAPKIQKPSVARVIVRAIRNGDPPGRFLKKDDKTGKWVDIGDKKAAEKTSQALREKTNEEKDKMRRDISALGASAGVLLPNPSSYLDSATVTAFAMAGAIPTESSKKKEAKPAAEAGKEEAKESPDDSAEAVAVAEPVDAEPGDHAVAEPVVAEPVKNVEDKKTPDEPAPAALEDTSADHEMGDAEQEKLAKNTVDAIADLIVGATHAATPIAAAAAPAATETNSQQEGATPPIAMPAQKEPDATIVAEEHPHDTKDMLLESFGL